LREKGNGEWQGMMEGHLPGVLLGIGSTVEYEEERSNTTKRAMVRVHEVEVLGTTSPYSLLV
jgi:hypothetical protein